MLWGLVSLSHTCYPYLLQPQTHSSAVLLDLSGERTESCWIGRCDRNIAYISAVPFWNRDDPGLAGMREQVRSLDCTWYWYHDAIQRGYLPFLVNTGVHLKQICCWEHISCHCIYSLKNSPGRLLFWSCLESLPMTLWLGQIVILRSSLLPGNVTVLESQKSCCLTSGTLQLKSKWERLQILNAFEHSPLAIAVLAFFTNLLALPGPLNSYSAVR